MAQVKLLIAHGGSAYDATQLVCSITNSGSYDSVGRTLDVTLLAPRYDKNQPTVPVAIGDNVQLFVGAKLQFDGYIFSLQRDSGSDTVEVGCVDRGLYLKQNQAAYRFTGQTPEAITRQICRDFGLTVGDLAQTDVPIRRNFPGVSLYQIIMTAYTLAGSRTGARYLLRFRGAELDVIARPDGTPAAILPGSNLLTATVSEDARHAVSQVAIYNDSGGLVRLRQNEETYALIGAMQRYLKTGKDRDMDAEAAAILEDNGIQRTITVEAMGDPDLITGGIVIVQEPVTGLYGRYWIDSDEHTWKGGVYRTKLGLNLRKLMDKTEAGKELGK